MNILLVNPNRVASPPVPPIGLEYLAGLLASQGHTVSLADLCFSTDPGGDLLSIVRSSRVDLVCMTVSNIDSVIYRDNEFYLDGLRDLVGVLRAAGISKVLIGGAGLGTDPEGIVEYIGADLAVVGHAEGVLSDSLEGILDLPKRSVIWGLHAAPGRCSRMSGIVDYRRYSEAGGIAGFETHKGCSSACVYCIEAGRPVFFRDLAEVIGEIRWFVDRGVTTFHLCDSEFNEDLDYATAFLSALGREEFPMAWTLYMKPAEYSQKLFRLLKATGAALVTLSVDSFRKCPLYWQDIEKIVFSARAAGIGLAIDFLAGFPFEDDETFPWCLDFFRRLQPDRVSINTTIRLYRSLRLTQMILSDPAEKARIIGDWGSGFVRPVFYQKIQESDVLRLVGSDALFRIEGTGSGVNYSRFGLGSA